MDIPKQAIELVIQLSDLQELHRSSCNLILGFQQELEKLKQPPLHEASSVVANLLENNANKRLTQYQQAGCRHVYMEQQSIVKLNRYIEGLNSYIPKVQAIIEELEQAVDGVVDIMNANLDQLFAKVSVSAIKDTNYDDSEEPGSGGISKDQLRIADYAILMSAISSMIKEDLQMQELILADLTLDIDSERLQTYSQMWSLRPFVDDTLIKQALCWDIKL